MAAPTAQCTHPTPQALRVTVSPKLHIHDKHQRGWFKSKKASHHDCPAITSTQTSLHKAWQDKRIDWVSGIMHTLYPAVYHTIPYRYHAIMEMLHLGQSLCQFLPTYTPSENQEKDNVQYCQPFLPKLEIIVPMGSIFSNQTHRTPDSLVVMSRPVGLETRFQSIE